jgi:hypothetical protein
MNARDDTPGEPFELRCDAVAPWLWRVAWRGRVPPTEAEREELARVARSRESGALIVLAPADAAAPLPAALLPLTGATVAPLDVAALPPAEECGALRWFAPRGRGRVVIPKRADRIEKLVQILKERPATARAQAHLDAALADFAQDDGWRPLPPIRRALDDGELLPAATAARAFEHATGCDEIFVELAAAVGMAGVGAAPQPVCARLVRGSESFTLRLAAGGKSLGRAQLVLVRATAPADRGALLRVLLDDEDLGPWRLGDGQDAGRVSFDLFRISSDLLAGRERIRLEFRLEERREVAALRWWFLVEEEPDGLWLTELEAPRVGDRNGDGTLLAHDGELFLRGLVLQPGESVRYVLPRGERRLLAQVAQIAAADVRGRGALLTVTANGATTRVELPPDSNARRELARSVRGDELLLEASGDAAILLLAPKLLR